ncbi:uncharacterized protein LOC131931379 [Physella acuta]|uniref:uncharacterized protein LOC131931379 n=1 Tax=Physella acuta TaxID=109671 RepID=UPI0027DCA592|nr:uncharacterized protein LOC131931379 [Physella acuta]
MYLDLPCGIAVGNMVVLKGVYLNDTGFTLNLKNAANIFLNFRPRIKNLPVVTLNYKYNNVWGTEWIPLYNTFPFTVGQPFSLHILAGGNGYVIFIDGKWFIDGDARIRVSPLQTEQCAVHRAGSGGGQEVGRIQARVLVAENLFSLEMAELDITLTSQMLISSKVVLKGVYLNDTGFILNLRQNAANNTLHFRPRISIVTNIPVVTLNYKYNNVWGTEWVPLYSTFPFTVGQPFSLHILAGGTGYVIFIDGKWFCSFTYVVPPTSARYFEFTGAIKLLELSV